MSKYTTGEVAKLCGVSVRTVQYYDTRGILVPGELTEGGRRLYSDRDLEKMKIICFLRELGFSINSISQLLGSERPDMVIEILLDQQEQELRGEIDQMTQRLKMVENLRAGLKDVQNFSVGSIGDIALIMKNKKKLRKVHAVLITVGVIMDIIQAATLVLWISRGIWWPFAVGMPLVLAMGVLISVFYFKYTAYICPRCHEVFKPRFKEAFFAAHTPKTRKLTCPKCSHKGFCVETYDEKR